LTKSLADGAEHKFSTKKCKTKTGPCRDSWLSSYIVAHEVFFSLLNSFQKYCDVYYTLLLVKCKISSLDKSFQQLIEFRGRVSNQRQVVFFDVRGNGMQITTYSSSWKVIVDSNSSTCSIGHVFYHTAPSLQ
jgi:hypothetical protein